MENEKITNQPSRNSCTTTRLPFINSLDSPLSQYASPIDSRDAETWNVESLTKEGTNGENSKVTFENDDETDEGAIEKVISSPNGKIRRGS